MQSALLISQSKTTGSVLTLNLLAKTEDHEILALYESKRKGADPIAGLSPKERALPKEKKNVIFFVVVKIWEKLKSENKWNVIKPLQVIIGNVK